MPIIESRVDPQSESFRANRADMLALIDEFRALENKIRQAGETQARTFTKRGQILPRERLALLLDPGAPWLELSTLAGLRMHDEDGVPSGRRRSSASAMCRASAAWSAPPTARSRAARRRR